MSAYSEELRKHFLEPRNSGVIEDADGVGEARNSACGDVLYLYLSVGADGLLERTTFQAKACSAVIAVASMTTEVLSGMSVEQARALDIAQLVEQAGGLPRHKAHAPRVVARALELALDGVGP